MALFDPFRDFFLESANTNYGRLNKHHGLGKFAFNPAVDVKETPTAYLVEAELPGMKKEDIQLEAHDGKLTLSGERKQKAEQKGDHYHRVERSYGSFCRTFSLPENVKTSEITASFTDGVLELVIPKPPEVQPHKVTIS